MSAHAAQLDRSHPTSRLATLAVALEILLGVGALAGGLALMIGPRGEIVPLPLAALRGSPFDTYFVPGLILFGVLGLGPIIAARLSWLRHPVAPLAALIVGLGLMIWIAVEIGIIGYLSEPPLQALYGILGAVITTVGLVWVARTGWPG